MFHRGRSTVPYTSTERLISLVPRAEKFGQTRGQAVERSERGRASSSASAERARGCRWSCCVTLAPGRNAAGPGNDSPRRRTLAEADPPIAQPRTRPRCLRDSSRESDLFVKTIRCGPALTHFLFGFWPAHSYRRFQQALLLPRNQVSGQISREPLGRRRVCLALAFSGESSQASTLARAGILDPERPATRTPSSTLGTFANFSPTVFGDTEITLC